MCILESILILLTTALLIYHVSDITTMIPRLMGCVVRWKENVHIENSASLSRIRNELFFICLVPAGVLIGRLVAVRSAHFSGDTAGWITCLLGTGLSILYMLTRRLLAFLVGNKSKYRKSIQKASMVYENYFIVLLIIAAATNWICALAGADPMLSSAVIFREVIVLYGIMLIRMWQILQPDCKYLLSFLYLCSLEIIPAAFIAAAVIFL